MRYIDTKYCNVLLACILGALTLFSCNNDEEDVNEWTSNYVFLQSKHYLLPVESFKVVHNPTGINGDFNYTFSVKILSPVKEDITVAIEPGGSIPSANISLSSKQVIIKAGETSSKDIAATIDWSFAAKDKEEKNYDLQISISDIQSNGNDFRISDNLKTIKAKITKASFSPVVQTLPTGWTAVDRSKWVLSSSDHYDSNVQEHAIDGNPSTSWFSTGISYNEKGECWLNAKLDKSINLVGFSITKETAFGGGYSAKLVDFQVKKSGTDNWITDEVVYQLGSFVGNNPQYAMLNSTIDNINEFRINITSPDSYTGLSELNIYTK